MKKSKAERKKEREAEKRKKREERNEIRARLRRELASHVRICEVPGCRRPWTDMHHMVNPGRGVKEESYENVMGLCHEHHMQIDNTPNWSKVRWAAEYFWGCTYRQVADYVAMVRGFERAGKPTDIMKISIIDVPSTGEAFEVMRAFAERDIYTVFNATGLLGDEDE